jgi:hypothetical protein
MEIARIFGKSLIYKGEIGGAKRDRTADLLNAIQALSQLSYSPVSAPSREDDAWSTRLPEKVAAGAEAPGAGFCHNVSRTARGKT